MATVNITAAKGIANGAAVNGTIDTVTCTNFTPSEGFLVGVFKGEADQIVVSVNASLSDAVGNANGGEPAFDGKDVFISKNQLIAAGGSENKTIYVGSPSGTVEYWVKAV